AQQRHTAGMAAAFKFIFQEGVRAALCGDCFSAEMTRKHNDANILAMGARVVGPGLALKIVDTFLENEFEGGRHARRVALLSEIENRGE
ncbi:MAG: RpiB/LacA/LacB family sugar-phosphate isomerase, partial [Oscillospiraceae bacterium]|nr:RpiB/LacA/LacB family sugar-phosphate isomerase [Oscillospiraceae bacterium]